MIRHVYVVHHAHTDIGYTHGQSRIVRWHADFIRQAMAIASVRKDFAWTCETLYPAMKFWQNASPAEQQQFAALARAGSVGITGGFLHFSELPGAQLLESLADRIRQFGAAIGSPIHSAMHADINGCSLAHARALAGAGVQFLLTCVHPHHGYTPFGKRQHLFKWDLGDGKNLLVYAADHYHVGDELGLAPGAELDYCLGFPEKPKAFDDGVLERRLPVYLTKLERAGWPHDFCVIAVSGMTTDNSPPSAAIADRIARWNAQHGQQVRIEMTTPGKLAGIMAEVDPGLPVHTGDWPDWWADGVAGDPEAVALFRAAQRQRRWLAAIAAAHPQIKLDLSELDDELALFAEHTFGHSASVSSPWNLLAQQLRLKKLGFACNAADIAEVLTDQVCEQLGGSPLAYNRSLDFRLINPFPHAVQKYVELELEWTEITRWDIQDQVRIVNRATQQVLKHEPAPSMRGKKFVVDVTLAPRESVDLTIESAPAPANTENPVFVPDRAHDIGNDVADVPPASILTDHADIQWTASRGITSWKDRATGRELIHPQAAALPFTLVASRLVAPLDGEIQCKVRKQLGRNRNALTAEWSESRLRHPVSGFSSEHTVGVELDYAMPGCEFVRLRMNARRHQPRVDVELIMHKQGTWNAENLYLALPLTAGTGAQLYLDRSGPMRPIQDQLPGTLCDFYGVQDGLAWCGQDMGLAIAQMDSHLIQTGPLSYGVRQLSSDKKPIAPTDIYAWLMTNYWETNFSPELGGFYSFRFSVLWGPQLRDPSAAIQACQDATMDLPLVRLK